MKGSCKKKKKRVAVDACAPPPLFNTNLNMTELPSLDCSISCWLFASCLLHVQPSDYLPWILCITGVVWAWERSRRLDHVSFCRFDELWNKATGIIRFVFDRELRAEPKNEGMKGRLSSVRLFFILHTRRHGEKNNTAEVILTPVCQFFTPPCVSGLADMAAI